MKLFKKLLQKPKPKMYILVRLDLSETYRCVQGSHALAQFAFDHNEKFKQWSNQTIVFLRIRNLIELNKWYEKIGQLQCSIFREPDLDMQPTALAYYGIGKIFKSLKVA